MENESLLSLATPIKASARTGHSDMIIYNITLTNKLNLTGGGGGKNKKIKNWRVIVFMRPPSKKTPVAMILLKASSRSWWMHLVVKISNLNYDVFVL